MYDPKQTDYKQLLKVFLENHDATSLNKQGGDSGTQYRSGLYFHTEEQRQIAEEVMAEAAPSYEVNPRLELQRLFCLLNTQQHVSKRALQAVKLKHCQHSLPWMSFKVIAPADCRIPS